MIANAAIVPVTMLMAVTTVATHTEFTTAERRSVLPHISRYHCVVNPCQSSAMMVDLSNESTASSTIGPNSTSMMNTTSTTLAMPGSATPHPNPERHRGRRCRRLRLLGDGLVSRGRHRGQPPLFTSCHTCTHSE